VGAIAYTDNIVLFCLIPVLSFETTPFKHRTQSQKLKEFKIVPSEML